MLKKQSFWCVLGLCLLLVACTPSSGATPVSKPVTSNANLPTTAPWSEWTSEQREYFQRTALRAESHQDREIIKQLIQPRLSLIPGIVTEIISFSETVRRYGEVGWDDELYKPDDFLDTAELIGSVYAELTGDKAPETEAANRKLQVQAAAIGEEGYKLLKTDPQNALVKLLEAQEIFITIKNQEMEAKTVYNIGVAYVGLQDYKQGCVYFEDAYTLAITVKDYNLACEASTNLALIYSALKLDDQSKDAARRAIQAAEDTGNAEKAKSIRQQMESLVGKP